MKQTNVAIATQSSYISIDVTQEIQVLEKEIKGITKQITMLTLVQFKTQEHKDKLSALETEREVKRSELVCLFGMEKKPIKSWCHNGSPKPGLIIDRVKTKDGQYKLLVDYDGTVKLEPQAQVTLVDDSYAKYIWFGGYNRPTFKRKGDEKPCDDLKLLLEEYESNCRLQNTSKTDGAKEDVQLYKDRKIYCKKRFSKLTRDRFPAGTKILYKNKLATVTAYPQKQSASLEKLAFELEDGLKLEASPLEIEIAPATKKSLIEGDLDKPGLHRFFGKPEIKTVPISAIKKNGGTQQRVAINHETVKEYVEAMREGDKFPPVKLFFDGQDYWLADGFHTTETAWSIGKTEIDAIITQGTQRDAILASVGVNADHGLRRSNADKRKSVTTLLKDAEWQQWSDREIARRCKVTHPFVAKLRSSLTGNVSSNRKYIDKHGNELVMQTQNIGSNQDSNCPDKESIETVDCPDNLNAVPISSTNNNLDEPVNDPNFPLHPNAKQLEITNLVDGFEIGQLVRIKPPSDRPDKRLVGWTLSTAVVVSVNPHTVDIKNFDGRIEAVSPNDLELVRSDDIPQPRFCISPNLEDLSKLLIMFDSAEEVVKAAIAAGSLNI